MKDDKKVSGGKRRSAYRMNKKAAWRGGTAADTKTDTSVSEDARETKKGRGGTEKTRATAVKYATVLDKATKKAIKAEIIAVKTNDANRLFARANISTKGALIRVKVGSEEKLARVTNRPGQDGVVNAVLEA